MELCRSRPPLPYNRCVHYDHCVFVVYILFLMQKSLRRIQTYVCTRYTRTYTRGHFFGRLYEDKISAYNSRKQSTGVIDKPPPPSSALVEQPRKAYSKNTLLFACLMFVKVASWTQRKLVFFLLVGLRTSIQKVTILGANPICLAARSYSYNSITTTNNNMRAYNVPAR